VVRKLADFATRCPGMNKERLILVCTNSREFDYEKMCSSRETTLLQFIDPIGKLSVTED